jgi:hypothetical protein
MADAIRFKEFLVANTTTNKTIEENVKTLFSYAGIHDRSFDSALDETWEAAIATGVWASTPATGIWTAVVASGQAQGIGDGGSDWDYLLTVEDMPSEAELSVYKNCNRGGLVFRGTDANDHYLFFWDSDSCGFKKKSSGTYTTLLDIPKVYTGEGDITLCWREMKFRAMADEKWLFMSAWMDGELMATAVDDISSTTPGKKAGLAVYDTDTVNFGEFRIPELTEIIEWCSVDVGESPGSALSRMLGRRHIKYFLRYDGTLRMWRPKAATSTWTYQRQISGFNWNVDYRNLVSHWRQVGAWEEADYLDTALLEKGITRFHKDDNPDLMTKESCYTEAGYAIQRLKEIANRVDMRVPAQVLQEPEDVVTVLFVRDDTTVINSVDYIVDLEASYTVTFSGNKLTTELHLRKQE